ncbi:MAG: hypothetical protein FJX34_05220 [Alphaproteobacteria bacterium]|nr:hypothetical protein [Alphaproteobacteria bacterium]
MQLFRKLSNSIFFKIILAFVALSFVLFGVSSFILGNPNSWVAKVGSHTISYNTLNSALKSDRAVVLASAGESDEVMKYLESEKFKSDVIGRLVNQAMIKKLTDEFDITASRKLILESVAKDQGFKGENGKFDHKKFEEFLAKQGLNEERYVGEVADSVVATMALQSLSLAAPISLDTLVQTESFKQEKRVADVITVSTKDVGNITKPTDAELQKFFSENATNYTQPELRKVSYLSFSKKDFAKDLQISDQEIFAEYDKNKEQFTKPETRSLYHVMFEKEEDAKSFLQKFGTGSKLEFGRLAKDLAQKDLKAITMAGVTQKDLIPQLTDVIFKLKLNEHSAVIESPLGFHVFLLNEIKQPQLMPFSEVKSGIKQKLAEGREDKILQGKISAIDDTLLTSNSLLETAKKFNLKLDVVTVDESFAAKGLADFAKNAFAAKEKQVSKIFYAQNSADFYALNVDEITPAKQQELVEVKDKVTADLIVTKKQKAAQELALKIEDEVKKNPDSAAQIAAKNHVKFEKSYEFPRVFYLNFQGQQIPYQDKFLGDLFDIQLGQATPAISRGSEEFTIGVLREIKKPDRNSVQLAEAKTRAQEEFRGEVMREYNKYLLSRYPVKTNEKIFAKQQEE